MLQEINGTKLKDNVDTWIDFDQQSLTISFFTSLKSLLQEGEESSETVGAKFVFVDNYNQVER